VSSRVESSRAKWNLSFIVQITGVISSGDRVETPFPLLKCLRTHYGRHCELFSGQNELDCRILRIQSLNFPRGVTPEPALEAPPVLGPRHRFLLGSPVFPLFLLYETTNVNGGMCLTYGLVLTHRMEQIHVSPRSRKWGVAENWGCA